MRSTQLLIYDRALLLCLGVQLPLLGIWWLWQPGLVIFATPFALYGYWRALRDPLQGHAIHAGLCQLVLLCVYLTEAYLLAEVRLLALLASAASTGFFILLYARTRTSKSLAATDRQ
jgi:hypothetical protein